MTGRNLQRILVVLLLLFFVVPAFPVFVGIADRDFVVVTGTAELRILRCAQDDTELRCVIPIPAPFRGGI
jgi:hypothetical protein